MQSSPPAATAPRPPGPQRTFDPPSRLGGWYLAAAAALALVLALALAVRGVTLGISFAGFACLLFAAVLLAVGLLAAYWAWACLALRYELRTGVLTVHWGLHRHEVPVALLQRAVRGRALAPPSVRGLDWPGCHIGHATMPRFGEVRVLSLHRAPAELLYLATATGAYAISVADQGSFIQALKEHGAYMPAIPSPRVVAHPLFRAPIWADRPAQLAIATALALALLATGIVSSRYAGFPDRIQLRFPEGTRTGGRTELLGIPAWVWLLFVADTTAGLLLLARRSAAAYTLLYGLVFVEALLVAAALTAA